MSYRFIMTAFGKDRVGIVADVTRLLYENDCNLEDTTMNMLVDEFTLSLLFSSQDSNIEEQLSRECRRLEVEKGVSAFVRAVPARQPQAQNGYKTCTLRMECVDQAGIVYRTSLFLANNSLNIIHLNSTSKASPESGASIYCMDIDIQVPEEMPLDKVEEDLNGMADELQIDISMSR